MKTEKLPGGELSDCAVLNGVMFNKDVTHAKMRRRIENPRVLLLDCPLEYKKGESQTNVEITKEEDWDTLLRMEVMVTVLGVLGAQTLKHSDTAPQPPSICPSPPPLPLVAGGVH